MSESTALLALRIVGEAVKQSASSTWNALAKLEARLERRVDRFIDTGWRRAFGWMGLAVAGFSYIYAPMNSIAVDYVHVDIFLSFATGMYVVRGVEKLARDRLGLPVGPMGPGAAAEMAA